MYPLSFRRGGFLFAALLASSLFSPAVSAADAVSVQPPEGATAVVPRAKQYDLTSKINGSTYRVSVSVPFKAEAGKRYPVMYVTDGNWYFAPASINATESSSEIEPVIVVGIGYATDDNDVVGKRRAFELTPWSPEKAEAGRFGGGDTFLRVIEEEIKPFVNAHYAVDASRQVLFGKSYGGLIVLRQLFTNPGAYSTYIIASPAIAFNDRAILKDEAAFAQRAKAGELSLRILITAAGNEQYRGSDPALLAQSNAYRMVDNAMELADRLAALNPQKIHVEKAVIADESHVSVSLASVGRALYFALKR